MRTIKWIMNILKTIFDRRQTSYEIQAYMDLEMRKVSNLDDKKYNEKLFGRVS